MQLREFRCGKCGKVFITADENEPKSKLKCPMCNSLKLTRIASAYSTIDLIANSSDGSDEEEETAEPRPQETG